MLNMLSLLLLLIHFTGASQAYQQNNTNLDLVVEVEKTNYYVAEPIAVSGTLTNNKNVDIKILTVSQTVYYRKAESTSDFIPYTSNKNLSGPFISTVPTEFKSGEQISRRETLLYNVCTKQFVLDEPGVYDIKVSMLLNPFKGESVEYRSNVTQITVSEPLNEEKVVFKELKELQLGEFLNGLNSHPLYSFEGVEETAEKAISFVKKHRDSFYASLVSKQIKHNLLYVKRELELTKQSTEDDFPTEWEDTYNKVKTMIELEVDQD